jgi:hypothetical protein
MSVEYYITEGVFGGGGGEEKWTVGKLKDEWIMKKYGQEFENLLMHI